MEVIFIRECMELYKLMELHEAYAYYYYYY